MASDEWLWTEEGNDEVLAIREDEQPQPQPQPQPQQQEIEDDEVHRQNKNKWHMDGGQQEVHNLQDRQGQHEENQQQEQGQQGHEHHERYQHHEQEESYASNSQHDQYQQDGWQQFNDDCKVEARNSVDDDDEVNATQASQVDGDVEELEFKKHRTSSNDDVQDMQREEDRQGTMNYQRQEELQAEQPQREQHHEPKTNEPGDTMDDYISISPPSPADTPESPVDSEVGEQPQAKTTKKEGHNADIEVDSKAAVEWQSQQGQSEPKPTPVKDDVAGSKDFPHDSDKSFMTSTFLLQPAKDATGLILAEGNLHTPAAIESLARVVLARENAVLSMQSKLEETRKLTMKQRLEQSMAKKTINVPLDENRKTRLGDITSLKEAVVDPVVEEQITNAVENLREKRKKIEEAQRKLRSLPPNVHSGTGMNLVGKLRQLVRENKELQQQLHQDRIGRLNSQISVIQYHNTVLREENSKLLAQLTCLEKELIQLEEKAAELQRKLAGMGESVEVNPPRAPGVRKKIEVVSTLISKG